MKKDFEVTLPNGYTVLIFEDNGKIVLRLVNGNGFYVSDTKLTDTEIQTLKGIFGQEEGQFVVYDTCTHVFNLHKNKIEAEQDYEAAKEYIVEEPVTGDEQVYLLEVKKVATLVEDKERADDPAKHGFDYWVKWQDNE